MDLLINKITKKLEKNFFINFEDLTEREKKRLITLEENLSKYEERQVQALKNIDNLKLNKVKISEILQISRKTLYNDTILNKYVDLYLEEEKKRIDSYEVEYKKIREEYKELENRYDKLLCNIIELSLIKEENRYLKKFLSRQNYESGVSLNKDKVIEYKKR